MYTEPFGVRHRCCSGKPRATLVEVYNDLDREIVSLFEVLRCPVNSARLAELLQFTPFPGRKFQLAYKPCGDVVEQARRTLCRAFMGFGSDTASGAKSGFRANGNRNTAHPARDWANYPTMVASFCQRLQGVVVESRDAVELMLQHDSPQTLHYCDPPYVHETRSAHVVRPGKGYRHEMSDEDHRRLAGSLAEMRGMVIVSGYRSALYDELYEGWRVSTRTALADGARERTEALWMNAACAEALERSAGGLFAGVAACN